MDSERLLILKDRRTDLVKEREEISVRADQIEARLAELEQAQPTPSAPEEEAEPAPSVEKPVIGGLAPPEILTIERPIHLELIRIPAGEFLMGHGKKPIRVDEFYISKHPVTNAQYAVFDKSRKVPNGKYNHPEVVCLSLCPRTVSAFR